VRTVAYCGDYTALTTTKWGAKIYVDARDITIAPHIMLQGDWEPWITDCMAAILQKHKGCTFIDVGANVGWYTLLACGLGAQHVFSFEPNPRMVELLRKTIMVNGYRRQVTLTPAACGAAPGTMELVVNPEEAGGAHIESEGVPEHLRGRPDQQVPVQVVRLDDILGPPAVPPVGVVILKVDVEGFEPQVLGGAPELLKRRPIMFLEHNPSEASRALYESLSLSGYMLQHVAHSGHPGPALTPEGAFDLGPAEMLLFTHADG
jgi:FkbM family methyltransferase